MSGTWHESSSRASSPSSAADRRVMLSALDSFDRYRRTAHYNVTHRRRQNFYALPQAHWQLLSKPPFSILDKFDKVDDAIDANAKIARRIVQHSFEAFGIDDDSAEWRDKAKSGDIDKARSTIRQFFRDWSVEGEAERNECFKPVLENLQALYPDGKTRDEIKVLIPGAGLGRLVVEICALGFEVEGNEISFHQLMASNWILNGTRAGETFTLYPWAFTFSNQLSRDRQLQEVSVPDVHPGTYLDQASIGKTRHCFERMGMSAADFCDLYAQPDQRQAFDVVTTVYFIDTAPNLIRYLEAIGNTLKQGGYWVNLGPLLWHFEDRAPGSGQTRRSDGVKTDSQSNQAGEDLQKTAGIGEAGSVELTADETLHLVRHMGFEILTEGIRDQTQGYIQDQGSMMTTSYKVLHFVARKM